MMSAATQPITVHPARIPTRDTAPASNFQKSAGRNTAIPDGSRYPANRIAGKVPSQTPIPANSPIPFKVPEGTGAPWRVSAIQVSTGGTVYAKPVNIR